MALTTHSSVSVRKRAVTGSSPTGTDPACRSAPTSLTSKISTRLSGVLTAARRVPSGERSIGWTWALSQLTKDGVWATAVPVIAANTVSVASGRCMRDPSLLRVTRGPGPRGPGAKRKRRGTATRPPRGFEGGSDRRGNRPPGHRRAGGGRPRGDRREGRCGRARASPRRGAGSADDRRTQTPSPPDRPYSHRDRGFRKPQPRGSRREGRSGQQLGPAERRCPVSPSLPLLPARRVGGAAPRLTGARRRPAVQSTPLNRTLRARPVRFPERTPKTETCLSEA
jgi:hypothetical protein